MARRRRIPTPYDADSTTACPETSSMSSASRSAAAQIRSSKLDPAVAGTSIQDKSKAESPNDRNAPVRRMFRFGFPILVICACFEFRISCFWKLICLFHQVLQPPQHVYKEASRRSMGILPMSRRARMALRRLPYPTGETPVVLTGKMPVLLFIHVLRPPPGRFGSFHRYSRRTPGPGP